MTLKVVELYRHELFENGFGIECCDEEHHPTNEVVPDEQDCNNNSYSKITVKAIEQHGTTLPAHIGRSLAKIHPGDIVVELNGVSTAGQTVGEFEKNLKLSGHRIRLRLKSVNGYSMTNGYDSTTTTTGKSRSCETNLDAFGREDQHEELTMSSSSLIDFPLPSANQPDYDNLEDVINCSDFNQKIKEEIDARLKALDDEFDSNEPVLAETINKSVDTPSARRLAKRLHSLDGFKSTDVVFHLCKRNDFNQLVAEEYVKLFNFQGDTLDRALRKFVKQFTIIGETQDRERVLHFFAARYLDCNPTTFTSVDACHMLTCAIMLLNTDLHDPQFSENLNELNDGKDFSKDLLKSLYNAIKTEELINETILASDDYNDGRVDGHSNITNPYLEISDLSKSIEYMQGYLMRKCCAESDGKRTPFLRRGWKAYYSTLRDMVLDLHKNDHQPSTILIGDSNALRLHHAFAREAKDYRKRQHVFRLRTADWAEYLFQASDRAMMNKWIDAINLVAASFSSPPLAAAIDSSISLRFQRPLLPSVQTRYSVFEQYEFITQQINQITKQLNELRVQSCANKTINGDIQQIKACDTMEHKEQIEYLQYELQRYEAYADRLRRHFEEIQIDRSPLKLSTKSPPQQHHSFVGPIDSVSESNSSVSHKKSTQSASISLANRYSYLMAVNSHPVPMKEHRL